jgi:hypothetical protein
VNVQAQCELVVESTIANTALGTDTIELSPHSPTDVYLRFPAAPSRVSLKFSRPGVLQILQVKWASADGPTGSEISTVCRLLDLESVGADRLVSNVKNCEPNEIEGLPFAMHGSNHDPMLLMKLPRALPVCPKFVRLILKHETGGRLLKVYYLTPSDGSWSEERSTAVSLCPTGEAFEYLLPLPPAAISALRLDPTDDDGLFEIQAFELWSHSLGADERVTKWTQSEILAWTPTTFLSSGVVFECDDGVVLRTGRESPVRLPAPYDADLLRATQVQLVLSCQYEVTIVVWCDVDGEGQKLRVARETITPGESQMVSLSGLPPSFVELGLEISTEYPEIEVVLHEIALGGG